MALSCAWFDLVRGIPKTNASTTSQENEHNLGPRFWAKETSFVIIYSRSDGMHTNVQGQRS
jgi:hypothetical protein